MQRPRLGPHVRYRWDAVRRQHQLVFPEGILVLNDPGAVIVRLCDGRLVSELIAALGERFPEADLVEDVPAFLQRLGQKGLLCDAADP
jgi:pyrroloquinoline quinone biosynthesis protein D